MNQQQASAAAGQFITRLRALEDGDAAAVNGLADMFAEDAQLGNSILEREGRKRVGRDAIAAFWREYRTTFGAIRSEFHQVTTNDHAAGLFWRSDGQDARGQPLSYEGVTLLTFDEDGKIARFQGYFDPAQVTL